MSWRKRRGCSSRPRDILLVGPSNSWHLVSPTSFDGPAPNPLLQNHILLGVHSPLLYLGYVGMSVPFAFAVGALRDSWHEAAVGPPRYRGGTPCSATIHALTVSRRGAYPEANRHGD